MKRIILALLSALVICSCAETGKKSGKTNEKVLNYFDRIVSEYATGADGFDQKVVFNRETKHYQVFMRATMYDGSWTLEDEGQYTESINGDIVTCELDNAKLKRDDNEKRGSIFRVKINTGSRSASFISIAGESYAKEIAK